MVRPAINVPAVRALAVGGFGQLEGGVGTDILDVIRRFGLVSVRVDRQGLLAAPHPHGEVLLVSVLLVLYLSHRRGLAHRPILPLPLAPHFWNRQNYDGPTALRYSLFLQKSVAISATSTRIDRMMGTRTRALV